MRKHDHYEEQTDREFKRREERAVTENMIWSAFITVGGLFAFGMFIYWLIALSPV
jgi:hypothetical protein